MVQTPDVGMFGRAMRQELPSGPADDIDGEPPRAQNTPSAPLLGHLILIPKPCVTAEVRAFSRTSRSLRVMQSVSWPVSGQSGTVPASPERYGARFSGVRMGTAARPGTGNPAAALAGTSA